MAYLIALSVHLASFGNILWNSCQLSRSLKNKYKGFPIYRGLLHRVKGISIGIDSSCLAQPLWQRSQKSPECPLSVSFVNRTSNLTQTVLLAKWTDVPKFACT